MPMDGSPRQSLPPHLAGLDLSSAQQDKLFALIYPQEPRMREQEKQQHELMNELHKISNADNFDDAKAKQLAEKLASLEKERAYNHAKYDSQIYSILTTEQRKQLSEQKPHQQDNFHKSTFKLMHKPETKNIL